MPGFKVQLQRVDLTVGFFGPVWFVRTGELWFSQTPLALSLNPVCKGGSEVSSLTSGAPSLQERMAVLSRFTYSWDWVSIESRRPGRH
ncbi:hypothetical protein PBY51_011175 [Eleginops maclovinus]|uniref:Uncharacterized protein n=1 Tax=Eleginops maclovinus TaxID=56733 RepID=A0AAN8AJ29_ELEMC|nr:hypothetical protein PBY51_011175 [Eleginops maclovinus]